MPFKPVLVIHGGAGSIQPQGEKRAALEAALSAVLNTVYPALARGGTAVAAACRAVELLENDDLFNAGKGSKIQRDGRIRMSASLMKGSEQKFSGCVNVEGVKNPIRLAEKLSNEEFRVLAGRGGERFARQQGLKFASPFTDRARRHFQLQKSKFGTVGAIALDSKGRLAAATSTGGRGYETPNRVSDSPTVAGNYANPICAVSATGIGEQIVDFAVAARVAILRESGSSLTAISRALMRDARRSGALFGFIALDRTGKFVSPTTTPHLIWAAANSNGYHINP